MQIINGERLPTVTKDGIYGFFGDYRFLSNFYPAPIELDGVVYPSSEHAYVAQKTLDEQKQREIAAKRSPGKVKQLGQELVLRPNWKALRLPSMLLVLTLKFQNEDLKTLLLDTGTRYLQETNNWDDTYWGVCNGEGSNYLGQLLMLVRSNLQLSATPQKGLF